MNASTQNRVVEALRIIRATFVDHSPPAWQAFCSEFYAKLLSLRQGDPDDRQGKAQLELVFEEDLHMMQAELMKLDPAKIMDVRGVRFHLLQLEFHLGLRQDVLLVDAYDARLLSE